MCCPYVGPMGGPPLCAYGYDIINLKIILSEENDHSIGFVKNRVIFLFRKSKEKYSFYFRIFRVLGKLFQCFSSGMKIFKIISEKQQIKT